MLITGRFKLNISNNTFNDTREIHGFTKDEILEIKETLSKFKSEGTDDIKINEYLRTKLHISSELLDKYSNYLENIRNFTKNYLLPTDGSKYYYLKSEIMEELRVLTNNLQNLSSNIRNIKRITKNSVGLNELLSKIEDLLREMTHLGSELQESIEEIKTIYNDTTSLWVEINKIKNLNFKLNQIPTSLDKWSEIKELVVFIKSLNEVFFNKRKKDKKEKILTFHFDEIYQFFQSLGENKVRFYSDLIYLLYLNKIFEEYLKNHQFFDNKS